MRHKKLTPGLGPIKLLDRKEHPLGRGTLAHCKIEPGPHLLRRSDGVELVEHDRAAAFNRHALDIVEADLLRLALLNPVEVLDHLRMLTDHVVGHILDPDVGRLVFVPEGILGKLHVQVWSLAVAFLRTSSAITVALTLRVNVVPICSFGSTTCPEGRSPPWIVFLLGPTIRTLVRTCRLWVCFGSPAILSGLAGLLSGHTLV